MRGGVLLGAEHYNKRALTQFVDAGGRILVATSQDNKVDGAFLFTVPGVIPPSIEALVKEARLGERLSYAELFVTSLQRPNGTYSKLMRGMLAHLYLHAASGTFGFIQENNLHHQGILQTWEHQRLEGLRCKLEGRDFVVMYLELKPKIAGNYSPYF